MRHKRTLIKAALAMVLLVPATGGGTLKLYDPAVSVGGSFVAFKLAR